MSISRPRLKEYLFGPDRKIWMKAYMDAAKSCANEALRNDAQNRPEMARTQRQRSMSCFSALVTLGYVDC